MSEPTTPAATTPEPTTPAATTPAATTPELTKPEPVSEAFLTALGYTTLFSEGSSALFPELVVDPYGPTKPIMNFHPFGTETELNDLLEMLEEIRSRSPSSRNNISNKSEKPQPFDVCKPPARENQVFTILFRDPLSLCFLTIKELQIPAPPPLPPLPPIKLDTVLAGCVKMKFDASIGLDIRLNQKWKFVNLKIGDLSSTMSLAPSEQLTLEFQSTQRRLLEQSKVDSVEEMSSTETTTHDKEALNVTRTSSKTDNWHVDGTGHFIFEGGWADLTAGISSQITNTSQTSLEHITEVTNKSSESLKTLHKIEVRGVSENIIQNRMTRIIKNPYHDRTLSLNVFQLIKNFSVTTEFQELRPIIIITINNIKFDEAFVTSNSEFLDSKLLDPLLRTELQEAIKGAKGPPITEATSRARQISKEALHYLFKDFNMFNVIEKPATTDPVNANFPSASFDALKSTVFDHTGLGVALFRDVEKIFTSLNFFYYAYNNPDPINIDPAKPEHAILIKDYWDRYAVAFVCALEMDIGPKWDSVSDSTVLTEIMNFDNYNEIFRRISGFLAMISRMVKPIIKAVEDDIKSLAEYKSNLSAFTRLKHHLNCHNDYYVQEFLNYLSKKTGNMYTLSIVEQVLMNLEHLLPKRVIKVFDINRAFIDKEKIIIPAFDNLIEEDVTKLPWHLPGSGFSFKDIEPTKINIDVPYDGIHLEVAPGNCVLKNLPSEKEKSVELAVKAQSRGDA
jgi:hypothetical protein